MLQALSSIQFVPFADLPDPRILEAIVVSAFIRPVLVDHASGQDVEVLTCLGNHKPRLTGVVDPRLTVPHLPKSHRARSEVVLRLLHVQANQDDLAALQAFEAKSLFFIHALQP